MRKMNPDEISKMHHLEKTHWWFQGKKRIVETLLKVADIPEGDYLDIGCGTGMFLKVFSAHGNAFGLDASHQALSYCRFKGCEKVVQGTGDHLPFGCEKFSFVSLLDVVEHVDDDGNVLKEAYRVCMPGGIVLVTVPAFRFLWGSHDVVHNHKRRYTRNKLKRLGLSAGFLVERVTYTNFFIFFAVLAKRIVSRFITNNGTSDMKEVPRWVNGFLKRVYAFEANYLKKANFPWGVSVLMLLRKPGPV
jgi:SAM-dependent methyltransferase